MLYLYKTLLGWTCADTISAVSKLEFLKLLNVKYSGGTPSNAFSFTVSYLVNSCGFSPESAKSVAKGVSFKSPGKPDRVLAFFRSHGFSQSQISDIVRTYPRLLLSDPEKTLFPKLQFLRSRGLSRSETAIVIAKDPRILRRSIEEHIILAYNLWKSLVGTDEKTLFSIRRFPAIISCDIKDEVRTTIRALCDAGVPQSKIAVFLCRQPSIFVFHSKRFSDAIEEVKKAGFDPSTMNFLVAIFVVLSTTKSNWQKKIDIFKSWGWSEKQITAAFRSYPCCMTTSGDKIMSAMNFYVKELGWDSLILAKRPVLLSLSLEKRIIPRASVLQFLLQKRLDKKGCWLKMPYVIPEGLFLQKYVQPYQKEAPQLLKIYKEKMEYGMQQLSEVSNVS